MADTLWLLHFCGEGRGFKAGVVEYIYLLEEKPEEIDDYVAPGFNFESMTEIETVDGREFPASLPTEIMLERE